MVWKYPYRAVHSALIEVLSNLHQFQPFLDSMDNAQWEGWYSGAAIEYPVGVACGWVEV